jgi:hypothetical protein
VVTDAILTLFRLALKAVQFILPNWAPDIPGLLAPVLPALTTPFSWLGGANYYLPVAAALVLLVLGLTMWLTSHVYNGVIWVLTKMHVLGGAA